MPAGFWEVKYRLPWNRGVRTVRYGLCYKTNLEDAGMQDTVRPKTIGELPVQTASSPTTDAQSRARFFNSGNAFMVQLAPVPDMVFTDEPSKALDSATPTGLIECDISDQLKCDFSATSPFVLARYGRIKRGESLAVDFVASGTCYYVIQGSGTTSCEEEQIAWSAGDVFVAPGGVAQTHSASSDADKDAVLWIVTNEPLLSHEQVQAPASGQAPTPLVHYPADEIQRQVELIYDVGCDEDTAGAGLIFSSDQQEASRNVMPTLTLAMNSLAAGATQRPHRHNSVAVSLIVSGEKCFSTVDGNRKNWTPWATTITPPVSVHSHSNEGSERAYFLIVQDGGLYYHARANGFEFVDS